MHASRYRYRYIIKSTTSMQHKVDIISIRGIEEIYQWNATETDITGIHKPYRYSQLLVLVGTS
jgi:hypothetical protein